VLWNDGYSQTTNASLGSSATLIRTIYPTNSFGANVASNNVFFVTAVSNADMCIGNLPGDITGVVTNTINPRPTAALLSFNTTDCDEGAVYTLTNTLTGIGPWVVTWNDGLMQTNTIIGPGPVTLERTVYPTNSFGANTASNNVYHVTGVVDGTGCTGDQSGDITGVVTNTINPRPTSVLTSPAWTTNCNDGTPFTLTNVLTGIGPWTNVWSVDGQTAQQVAGSVGQAGPITNTYVVYPTNSFGANTPSNNVYYLAGIVNGDTCSGNQAGDITGTNTVVINPRPTSVLTSPAWTTNCNDGTPFTLTNVLTGIGPWTNVWSVDGAISNQVVQQPTPGQSVTNTYTVYPANSFGANTPSNNVYYLQALINGDICGGNLGVDITGTNTVVINPTPADPTAVSDDVTNVLGNPPSTLSVTVQPNETAYWYDITQTNLLATNNYTPAYAVCGSYTNYAVAEDTNTLCWSAGFQQVVLTIIPPAPVSNGDHTNNVLVPNPALTVTTYSDGNNPAGTIVADWYAAASGGPPLATATSSYTPPGSGATTYYAGARDINSGLESLTRTPVTIVLVTNTCATTYTTNNPSVINFDDLPPGSGIASALPASYDGLNWSGFYLFGGFGSGHSSPNFVAPLFGSSLVISSATPFDLISMNAANGNSFSPTEATIVAYTNGLMVYSNVVNVGSQYSFVPVTLNISNVTEVDFVTGIFMDDLQVSNVTYVTTNVDCSAVPGPPQFVSNYTNCAGASNPPLVVGVTDPSQLINWYSDSTGTNLLAWNVATNTFVPTNAAPGNYTFYAQAVATNEYVSPNPLTSVTLTLLDCLSTNASINVVGGTNISVSWFGNLVLQDTTNLAPPNWVDIFTNPAVGWTNIILTNGNPPIEFFRVKVP
jgi:hypothetical protein